MRGEREMSKIQRNNCHDGHCVTSFTGKTSLVSLISHMQAQKIAEWEVALTASILYELYPS